ncbi:MAG: LEA type 2 family protein [Phycisphaeraceae bacterium]|nr:LEA type 2 family protein [Phycisphaeraceae bacterium]
MNRPTIAVTGPLCALCLALPGCVNDPSIRVSRIVMGERSAEAVVVNFHLAADNPNDEIFPARLARYTVSVNGRQVFSGERSPEIALRNDAEQEFRLPATISLADGPLSGRQPYAISGSLQYTTPGQLAEVLFDTGVRRPSVSFASSGTIDFDAATGQVAADIPAAPARVRPAKAEPAPAPEPDPTPPPPRPRRAIHAYQPAAAPPPPPPPQPAPPKPTQPEPRPQPGTPMQPATPAPTPPPAPPPSAQPPAPAPATPPAPPAPPPREGFVPGKPIQPKPKDPPKP